MEGNPVATVKNWYMTTAGDRVWSAFKVVAKDINTSYKFKIQAKNGVGQVVESEEFTYSVKAYCDAIAAGSFSSLMPAKRQDFMPAKRQEM